jgi:hypothetical protein
MIINCLSVKNPWAYAILNLGKNIENRTKGTGYRGILYIHSSKIPDPNAVTKVFQTAGFFGRVFPDLTAEEMMLHNGCILGYVNMYDCVKAGLKSNPWWGEPNCFHWYLRDPVLLRKPVPAKGKLGIWQWKVPERWEEIIKD